MSIMLVMNQCHLHMVWYSESPESGSQFRVSMQPSEILERTCDQLQLPSYIPLMRPRFATYHLQFPHDTPGCTETEIKMNIP